MCKKEGTVQLKMKATGASDELIRLIEFVSLLGFKLWTNPANCGMNRVFSGFSSKKLKE
jgi:hypothetical protein